MATYLNYALVFFCNAWYSLFLISTGATERDLPTVSTKNVTAHYCPFPCTVGNETLCYPPPCPPPPCIDPAKVKPTDCCVFCPNGPNCRGPDGQPIQWNHWKIVDGKNCTCKNILSNATCVRDTLFYVYS